LLDHVPKIFAPQLWTFNLPDAIAHFGAFNAEEACPGEHVAGLAGLGRAQQFTQAESSSLVMLIPELNARAWTIPFIDSEWGREAAAQLQD